MGQENQTLLFVSESPPSHAGVDVRGRARNGAAYDIAVLKTLLEVEEFGPARIIYSSSYDTTTPTGKLLQLARRCLKLELLHGKQAVEMQPEVVISASEISAIPIAIAKAFLGADFTHIAVVHKIDSRPKQALQRIVSWLNSVDAVICSNGLQAEYLRKRQLVDPEKIHVVHVGIDTEWFKPDETIPTPNRPYLIAVGREQRDYENLIAAMQWIEQSGQYPNIYLKLIAGSRWSAQHRTIVGRLPKNVELITNFVPDHEVLQAYQQSLGVVVPILDSTYAAGVNGFLEGMAVQKPVLVTPSPGILDDYCQPYLSCQTPNAALQVAHNFSNIECAIRAVADFWLFAQHCSQESLTRNRQITQSLFSHERYARQIVEITQKTHRNRRK